MKDANNKHDKVPSGNGNSSDDESQDEVFGDNDMEEALDESETDEDADEGTGDGNLGRSRDDLFQK